MPQVYQQDINEHTKLGVWYITEDADFFLSKVPLQNNITHFHKRLQHLAGRYLLPQLFKDFPLDLIRIADTKKPFLANEAYHFSISHCGDYAAVIVSSKNRVGVDIEIVSNKIASIKNKFLSNDEQTMLQKIRQVTPAIPEKQLLTACWSMKETMFKWYGLGAIDFRKHLQINNFQIDLNTMQADCSFLKNGVIRLKLNGLLLHDNILTWTVT